MLSTSCEYSSLLRTVMRIPSLWRSPGHRTPLEIHEAAARTSREIQSP
jgi:hypothetical protein